MATRNIIGNIEFNMIDSFPIPNFNKVEKTSNFQSSFGLQGQNALKITILLYAIEFSMTDLFLTPNFKKVGKTFDFQTIFGLRDKGIKIYKFSSHH